MKIKRETYSNIVICVFLYYVTSFLVFYLGSKQSYNILPNTLDVFCLIGKLVTFFSVENIYINDGIGIIFSILLISSLINYHKDAFPLNLNQLQNLTDKQYCYASEKVYVDKNGNKKTKKEINEPYFKNFTDRIELGSFNLKKTKEEVENDLETLSNILKYKLTTVIKSEVKSGQLIFTIAKDSFSSIDNSKVTLSISQNDPTLLLGWGVTGSPVNIRLKSDFSIGIFGESGSGKSALTKEIIHQFLKLGFKVVIADVNLVDYGEIKKCDGVTYFDVTVFEELEAFYSFIDDIIVNKIPRAKKILEAEGVTHPLELKSRQGYPIEPTLVFVDEARAVINPKKETRKNYKELKTKLTTHFETGLSQFRKYGICLGLATQRLQQDELGIDFSNIKVICANGVDKSMNSKWCDGKMTEVVKGRWFVAKSETASRGIIKTPFTSPDFTLFMSKKNNKSAGIIVPNDDERARQSQAIVEHSGKATDFPSVEILKTPKNLEKKSKLKNKMAHFFNKEKK